jgi:hypothetical protein
MTRPRFVLPTIFALAVAVSSSARLAAERVEHAAAGIALDRPAGWHTATLAQVQENRQRVRLSDEELQRGLVTRSAMPVMAFMKYAEPFPGLNPTIQVTLRPAVAGVPTRVLSLALETLRRAFTDFRLVSAVEAVEIDGWRGAHARATYTLQNQAGQSFDVMTRFWLVPRGPLMFLIGMSGAQRGEELCEEEFAAVLRSIDIQD